MYIQEVMKATFLHLSYLSRLYAKCHFETPERLYLYHLHLPTAQFFSVYHVYRQWSTASYNRSRLTDKQD